MSTQKIKVLLAKVSLDSHDRGIKVIARWLADAGMEVIYLGPLQTVDGVVKAAIQESVDMIGLSFLCGEHLFYTPKIIEQMKANNLDDVVLIIGGVIPKPDIEILKEMGVAEVFIPDSSMKDIVDYINSRVKKH